jgi:hypothetical protein
MINIERIKNPERLANKASQHLSLFLFRGNLILSAPMAADHKHGQTESVCYQPLRHNLFHSGLYLIYKYKLGFSDIKFMEISLK